MKYATTFKQRRTTHNRGHLVSKEGLEARGAPFTCVKTRGQYWDAIDSKGRVRVFYCVDWEKIRTVVATTAKWEGQK